jgi:hypothetical protein
VKRFVVGSLKVLGITAGGLALGLALLMLIAKYRHAVGLAGAVVARSLSRDHVVVRGTWTSDLEPQEPPIQTSEIRCAKELMTCTEATAQISRDDVLEVGSDTYQITDWQPSRIVYTDESDCVNYIYTIDLLTTSATGVARRKADATDPICTAARSELRLSLKGGTDVIRSIKSENVALDGVILFFPVIALFAIWLMRATYSKRIAPQPAE